jgi:hypothetical protein
MGDTNVLGTAVLKHMLALSNISYGFADRKIFFFVKKCRHLNFDLIGIA